MAGGIDPDRLKNMQMALADRQVVFKGECAKCHAEPAVDKTGEQLYVAACGICHDSVHRAAMVPDLKKLNHPTNEEHWRKWTRSGRPGSMMPGFAKTEGGPLTDEQIESLVKFLTDSITAKAKPVNGVTPVTTSAQVQPQRVIDRQHDARPEDQRAVGPGRTMAGASSPSKAPKAAANPHKSICWRRACVNRAGLFAPCANPGEPPSAKRFAIRFNTARRIKR